MGDPSRRANAWTAAARTTTGQRCYPCVTRLPLGSIAPPIRPPPLPLSDRLVALCPALPASVFSICPLAATPEVSALLQQVDIIISFPRGIVADRAFGQLQVPRR